MGKGSDRDYYQARISAERAAAERATSEHARRAHLRLADEYEQLLNGDGRETPEE
jgi:hypothetical protein